MSRQYIAQTLKRLRTARGLTASEVGALVGKSGKTVNAWENNRGQPDVETLIMLCDIYQVDDILAEFRKEKKSQIVLDEEISLLRELDDEVIFAQSVFSERFKLALQNSGMTAGELSAKTDIPKSAISQYLSGAFKPRQTRTFLLAEALSVDAGWLMGYDVPMNGISSAPSTPLSSSDDGICMYNSLDDIDRAEIRGMMRQMLKADKYKKKAPSFDEAM